ncbi:hypothetical protein OSB04_013564 [Centaurea solstitialis]|uniref:Rieske domain-containing protein n=1 Tax=Centaurea solstitialis TaxID=347529 RepID=A0AA38WNI2_9ASTR|nr:hypothetical protein OSB04_013564 [Centaurea solstitialis]
MSSLLFPTPPPPTTTTNRHQPPLSLHHPTKPLTLLHSSRRKTHLRVAAPPSSTTTTTTTTDSNLDLEIQESEKDSSSKFSWRDHWYPVSLIEDLDPNIPTPFTLLNRDLVIWFDKINNKWVAFDDKCPHRLAPLSEGRIDENGDLQCSYHGWSFDGRGSCSRIPQAAADGPEARAVQSPRACATRFPTLVSQGLLFVWPDENGSERAAATKPPMLPDDFVNPEFSTVTIQRDLFYGYDTLMENVSDPSHIDFAHHKVTGRRDRAKPLPFKMDSNGHWGFSGENEGNQKSVPKIDTKLPIVGDQKWVIWICSFNVPMVPGKTRSIVCSARNFFQFTMPGPSWWQVVPRWHEHWTSNKVYDGDMIVLQGQEKVFLSKSMEGSADVNQQYTKLTFTPTQADRFVLAFRNWLRRHGNSQPEWFGNANVQSLPSTYLSKREMLDRYEQHTLKCSSCKKAHKSFETLKKFLIGSAVVLCAAAGVPPEIQIRLVFAGLAVLSGGLAYYCHELQKNFVFVDYVHAEIE